MIWSRRSFLKLALTASAGALAPMPSLRLVAQLRGTAGLFAIGRPGGGDVIRAPLSGQSVYRWVAYAPDYELVFGPGLENRSSFDVKLHHFYFHYDDAAYSWNRHGIRAFDEASPVLTGDVLIEEFAVT